MKKLDKILRENQMYSNWAFSPDADNTPDADTKYEANLKLYDLIRDLAQVEYVRTGYAHTVYKVVNNPHNLSTPYLALIADKGNLCFGYRVEGNLIKVHTD